MAPSVELGSTEDKLRKDDLLGALICSMAAYMNNSAAEGLFGKAQEVYPSPSFLKVHMSQDPFTAKKQRRGQKFLVAYTADCVFIAFRGTMNLKDVASDLCTNSERRFGGTFHKGFYDRADSFLGSEKWNPLPDFLVTARCERRRIIFCGHSLGGAVAHMVLFRFLLHTQFDTEQVTSEKYPDSMISIAFGAPHICDEEAACLINEDSRFKWRFINFVNQNDPVPHMLHDLKKTTADVLRGLLEEADKVLKSLGGFASRCVEGFEESGPGGALQVVEKETAYFTGRYVVKGVKKLTLRLQGCSYGKADKQDLTEAPRAPDFFPIGQYLCIKRESGQWDYKHYPGGSCRITDFFLEEVEYSHANVEQHLLNSYRGALVETGFIDSPKRTGETASPVNLFDPCLVTTPAPKVSIARWKAEEQDSGQRFVIVEGENLLFLREAVSITGSNGQEDWEIGKQSDKFLSIYDPKDSSAKHKDCDNAISMVFIKTAFGETSHPIVHAEDYPSKERMLIGAQRMLKKIAESLMVKATPPLSIHPNADADVMASLDDIMHCVPLLKGKGVSHKLTQITKFTNTDGGDFLDHIKDINYMFKQVISCSNSWYVHYYIFISDFHFNAQYTSSEGILKGTIHLGFPISHNYFFVL